MKLDWNEYRTVENKYQINAVFLENVENQYEDEEFLKNLNIEKEVILIVKSKNDISLGISYNTSYYGDDLNYVLISKNIKEGTVLINYSYEQYILTKKEEAKDIINIIKETKDECEKMVNNSEYYIDIESIIENELSTKDMWNKEDIKVFSNNVINDVKREIENRQNKEKEIENNNGSSGEIVEEVIWNKKSYIKYKDQKGNWIEINKNKLKYIDLEIELINTKFNKISSFFDVKNMKYSGIKTIADRFIRDLYSKYCIGIYKDITAKIRFGNNKFKFIFKKDKGGIFFEDKRIHKSRFDIVLNYIIDNCDNLDKNMIDILNTMSGIMLETLKTDKIIITSYFRDELSVDIEFKCEKKDVWKVKINDKEYTTTWKSLKKYFVYGHRVYKRIDEGKFLQFLDEIGEKNSIKVYKELLFFSKL